MNLLNETPTQAAIRRVVSDIILEVASDIPRRINTALNPLGLAVFGHPYPVNGLREVERALLEQLNGHYGQD